MRLLNRLRPGPCRPEVDHVAVVLGLLLSPDRLDRLDPLAQQLPPRAELRPVICHLLAVPAAADAEDQAPVRNQVEAGRFLGGVDGVPLAEEADPHLALYLPRCPACALTC